MSKCKILVAILYFNLLAINKITAKENDFGVWIGYSATKKIRAATFGLQGEFYTFDNSSKVERLSLGLKGDYQFLPWLSAGTGYMLINFYRAGYSELAERIYLQVEPSWHRSDFYFTFRERFQMTLFPETRTDALSSYYWRNQLEMVYKHNSSKIEPLTSFESLVRIGNPSFTPTLGYRISVGLNYHPTKKQKIKIYGMLTDGSIVCQYILGVTYEIKL